MKKKNSQSLIIARILMVVLTGVVITVLMNVSLSSQEKETSKARVVSVTNADLLFEGTRKDAKVGYDLEIGDFDGDGLNDLVFLRWGRKKGYGYPYVDFFLGKNLKSMRGIHTPDEADISVCLDDGSIRLDSGDFNGDGKDDLLLIYRNGLHVILGGDELLETRENELENVSGVKITSSSKDNLRRAEWEGPLTTKFIDWNRDGKADIIIYNSIAHDFRDGERLKRVGKIFVIFGCVKPPKEIDIAEQSDITLIGKNPDDCFGGALIDINGDKRFELIEDVVTEDQQPKLAGCVRIYQLPHEEPGKYILDRTDAYLVFNGIEEESYWGRSKRIDDFDGDGLVDLMMVRYVEKFEICDFFLGKNLKSMTGIHTPEDADFSLRMPNNKELGYGFSRYETGDFNGDGKADFFVFLGRGKKDRPTRIDLFLNCEKFLEPGLKDANDLPKIEISSSSSNDLTFKIFDTDETFYYDPIELRDLNRDGNSDLVITHPFAEIFVAGNKFRNAGKIYIINGQPNPSSSFDIATQCDLVIRGERRDGYLAGGWDRRGFWSSDVNSDGIYDFILNDPFSDTRREGKKNDSGGKIYIIFGQAKR